MNLDEFTKSYIKCALSRQWLSRNDNSLKHISTDISDETIREIIEDCQLFQSENSKDISTNLSRAGHDFFLTRNDSGGFWDGDWDFEIGERLTKACLPYGEYTLYVNDDGKIYRDTESN